MESKDSDFFVTGFVILIALVLIVFGAIVTVFFTSWVNMFIDNVSLSLHQQEYRHSLVYFQCSLTESEDWASRSSGVWRGVDGLILEDEDSSWKHPPNNTALHPRWPDISVLQYVLFLECFWCDTMIHMVFGPAFFRYEPLKFLLWCLLKDEVYSSGHRTAGDLKGSIKDAASSVSRAERRGEMNCFFVRYGTCLQAERKCVSSNFKLTSNNPILAVIHRTGTSQHFP
jgi:hypothetical protein